MVACHDAGRAQAGCKAAWVGWARGAASSAGTMSATGRGRRPTLPLLADGRQADTRASVAQLSRRHGPANVGRGRWSGRLIGRRQAIDAGHPAGRRRLRGSGRRRTLARCAAGVPSERGARPWAWGVSALPAFRSLRKALVKSAGIPASHAVSADSSWQRSVGPCSDRRAHGCRPLRCPFVAPFRSQRDRAVEMAARLGGKLHKSGAWPRAVKRLERVCLCSCLAGGEGRGRARNRGRTRQNAGGVVWRSGGAVVQWRGDGPGQPARLAGYQRLSTARRTAAALRAVPARAAQIQ